jgi:hypothetical protein
MDIARIAGPIGSPGRVLVTRSKAVVDGVRAIIY